MLAFSVFAEDVDLDVEEGAGDKGVETRGGVGVGDDGDLDHVVHDGGDSEADSFYGDGALRNDVSSESFGELDTQAPVGLGLVGRDRCEREQRGCAVYVALDYVAT